MSSESHSVRCSGSVNHVILTVVVTNVRITPVCHPMDDLSSNLVNVHFFAPPNTQHTDLTNIRHNIQFPRHLQCIPHHTRTRTIPQPQLLHEYMNENFSLNQIYELDDTLLLVFPTHLTMHNPNITHITHTTHIPHHTPKHYE